MANTLGIPEVTLAQLADSTNAVNVYEYPFEQRTCRVTNHDDDDNTKVADETESMAIFMCKAKGHPWLKQDNVLNRVIHETVDPLVDVIPTNVAVLYPDWDYTEF